MQQTGIEDVQLIENILKEENGSISDTIMKLMNYTYMQKPIEKYESKSTQEFIKIREIVSEKENVFYQLLNTAKSSNVENSK